MHGGELERVEFTEVHMGCRTRIVAWARSSDDGRRACEAAFERFAALEQVASDWRPTSELASLGPEPRPVSDDLLRLLTAALRAAEATHGAFDPTVGPLTRLWRRRGWSPAEAKAALALVDRRGVRLVDGLVRLERPGMALDLGGIAKGDACDQAPETLRQNGVESALVASGGDLTVSAPPPGHPGWSVRLGDGSTLSIAHSAVSTSGLGAQSVGGVGHVVCPRRGFLAVGLGWVTVIGARGIETEPWATALALEGPPLQPTAEALGLRVVWSAGGGG